jgi:hypothetical protein
MHSSVFVYSRIFLCRKNLPDDKSKKTSQGFTTKTAAPSFSFASDNSVAKEAPSTNENE